MTLLEVEYTLVAGTNGRLSLDIYFDSEKAISDVAYQGTTKDDEFNVVANDDEHSVRFRVLHQALTLSGAYMIITKAQYGGFDLLAQSLEYWEIDTTGTIDYVDEGLKITPTSPYSTFSVTGVLPEQEPKQLPISFDWEVSSEEGWDFFEGVIDGMVFLRASGIQSGSFYDTVTHDEPHTLRFAYTKDSSAASNEDCGRVGNIIVGGENWLANGLEGWTLGGDVLPVLLPDGRVELKCSDDQSSWMERTYEPPPDQIITNIRIRHLLDGQPISQFAVEALDTFFVDAVVEGFDLVTGSWIPVEPTLVEARLERYDETGVFEQISDSQVFAHPDGFFRLLQKCDAPPGTYYLKTTATVGEITQIERLKIKAKVNI